MIPAAAVQKSFAVLAPVAPEAYPALRGLWVREVPWVHKDLPVPKALWGQRAPAVRKVSAVPEDHKDLKGKPVRKVLRGLLALPVLRDLPVRRLQSLLAPLLLVLQALRLLLPIPVLTLPLF